MRCPKCRGLDSAVVNAKPRENETQRWRLHECKRCGNTWATIEITERYYQQLQKGGRRRG